MPHAALRYIICYDVPDDRRRTRLAHALDKYGDRVQYSVFEAVLEHRLFDSLMNEMHQLIKPEEDRIHVYPFCAACADRVQRLGAAGPAPGEEIVFVV